MQMMHKWYRICSIFIDQMQGPYWEKFKFPVKEMWLTAHFQLTELT